MDLNEKIAARKRELAAQLSAEATKKNDAETESRTKGMFAEAAISGSSEFRARVDEEVALRLTEMGIDPKTKQPFGFDIAVNRRVEQALMKAARQRAWRAQPKKWLVACAVAVLSLGISWVATFILAVCIWISFSKAVKRHRTELTAEGEAATAKSTSLDGTVGAPRSEQIAQLQPALTQADAQGSVGFVPWKEQAQDPINHNSNHQEEK